MDMRNEIRRLARIQEGPYPFLSCYLNTKWDDEQQRERIRLFIKNQLKKGYDQLKDREDWKRFFSEDQQQIERYVEGLVRRAHNEEVNGLALFSCGGQKIFITYPSIIPFENEFFLSNLPTLRPLVRLSSQYQNTLVAMIETDSAKLFEVSLEGMTAETSLESYVPGRHDQGGWAQMRYQRHIKDHMDKHHKDVAEHLTEFFDSGKWKRIILIGQDRIIANFKVFLPERVKQQIADTFSVDFSAERSEILKQVFERLLRKEREEVDDQIQELMERAYKSGGASFGLNETLEALNGGQVHTLYLLTSFCHSGGKCSHCSALSQVSSKEDSYSSCPLCSGKIKSVDLAEEMTRSSLRQDGEVKWVEENNPLTERGGVGASLRFRLSR